MVILPCALSMASTNVNVALNGNINNAIVQVNKDGGGTVTLAAGTWTIGSSIDMLSNVTLVGAGETSTSLVATGGFNVIQETKDGESDMAVENLNIVGVSTNTSSNGVYIDSLSTYNSNITINKVEVEDCGGIGCQLKRCNTFLINDCDFQNNGITDLEHNCYCFDVNNGGITNDLCLDSPDGSGIHLNTDSSGGTCDNVTISGCICSGNGQDGMDIMGTLANDTVQNNYVEYNNNTMDGGYGIRIWTGSGSVLNNIAEGNAVASYNVSAGWTLQGNITLSGGPARVIWNNAGGTTPGNGQTWDINSNYNWNNGAAAAVYTDGSDVFFNDTNNDNYAVTLNTTVSPALVTVNNSSGNYVISGSGSIAGAGSLTKGGTGSLTLNTVNTYTGGTTVTAGTLVAGVHGALPDGGVNMTGGTLQLASGTGETDLTSLAISGSGSLDITNNRVVINYGSGSDPIASIAEMIQNGYANGAWTGPGIISSDLQAGGLGAGVYGIGYADSADPGNPAALPAGTVEIMYTLLGDANLDGKVNGEDFTLLAANFNDSVTNGWDEGDFNYDGKVNGEDFVLLANNFNQFASQSAISAADLAALDDFAVANGISVTSVPEPMSTGIAVMAAIGMIGRRVRK